MAAEARLRFNGQRGEPQYEARIKQGSSPDYWRERGESSDKDMVLRDSSSLITAYLKTQQGLEFVQRSFEAMGETLGAISLKGKTKPVVDLELRPVVSGPDSLVFQITNRVPGSNQRDRSIIVNVAAGTNEESSQIIRDDFRAMSDLHRHLPNNSPAPLAQADIESTMAGESRRIAIYSIESVGPHEQVFLVGGERIRQLDDGRMTIEEVPIIVCTYPQLDSTQRRQPDLTRVYGDRATMILTRMVSLQAEAFIRSGEEFWFMPEINSGDLVLTTNTDSEHGDIISVLTARRNLLDDSFASNAQADPLYGRWSAFGSMARTLTEGNLDGLFQELAQDHGMNTEEVEQIYRSIAELGRNLTPRQRFAIGLLMHFESLGTVFPDGRRESQFWPAECIVNGIGMGLAAARNLQTPEAFYPEMADWWRSTDSNGMSVQDVIQGLVRILDNPVAEEVFNMGLQALLPTFRNSIIQRGQKVLDMLSEIPS